MIDVRKDTSRSMNLHPFARSDLQLPAFEDAVPAVSSGPKVLRDLAGDGAAIWPESPLGGWAFQRSTAYHSSFDKEAVALAISRARDGSCFAEIDSGQGVG